MCDLSLHGVLRVCQKGGGGEGRGGEGGGTVHLLCVFLLGGGGGKRWWVIFLDMIFYGVQCFLLRRVVQLSRKKSSYPHISHQFSLPSVASLCGLAQQGSTGYFLVNNTNQLWSTYASFPENIQENLMPWTLNLICIFSLLFSLHFL